MQDMFKKRTEWGKESETVNKLLPAIADLVLYSAVLQCLYR